LVKIAFSILGLLMLAIVASPEMDDQVQSASASHFPYYIVEKASPA